MTLASVGGQPILYPPITSTGATVYNGILLDASGEKAGWIFRAPKTGSIRYVHFMTGTVTAGCDVDVRIETVDETVTPAVPSGTLWGTNTNITETIDNADDNTWITSSALTADASVTKGDLVAVVIVWGTGGNLNINRYAQGIQTGFPYGVHYTTAWAALTGAMVGTVQYSDSTIENIPGVFAHSGASSSSSTSSTLNRGMKITMPYKARVCGLWINCERITASGTWTFKLFGTDGTTVLLSKAWDSDSFIASGQSTRFIPFDSTTTLSAGSTYWLTGVSDGTSSLRIHYMTYTNSTVFNAMAPGGGNCVWSQATSPASTGDWADTANQLPIMGLLIDQLDDGAGGAAGLMVHGGMTGGVRG